MPLRQQNQSLNMHQRSSTHVVKSPLLITKDMVLEDQEVAEILQDRNSTMNNSEMLALEHPISFSCDDDDEEDDDEEDPDYEYGDGINSPLHNPTS